MVYFGKSKDEIVQIKQKAKHCKENFHLTGKSKQYINCNILNRGCRKKGCMMCSQGKPVNKSLKKCKGNKKNVYGNMNAELNEVY
jgi:hypothetical protein